MDSFDRLLKIYSSRFTVAEHAQTFLWYHLRKYPEKKTASLKEIQKYFRRADREVPSIDAIREAFTTMDYPRYYPPGSKPDTFGMATNHGQWWDGKFSSCFEEEDVVESTGPKWRIFRQSHPFWFGLSMLGSLASIIGLILFFAK